MLLLGFAGRAKAGKSEAAQAVKDYAECVHGDRCEIFDIGSLILRYCKSNSMIPCDKTREQLSEAELDVLVRVGKERRDTLGQDYWISQIDNDITRSDPDVAVIPNVRYRSEVKWLRKHQNNALILVSCKNQDGSPFISRDRDPNHPSETELFGFNPDYFITAKIGESVLVTELAMTIFGYVRGNYAA